jgi:L-ectoine synthase
VIVRKLQEAEQTGRRVVTENWESTRLLLKEDNVGFSFHITTIYKGAELHMHYMNHYESVYCISGKGRIENVADGKIYTIEPGTIYILDRNDRHILYANEEMKLACVFNPALVGKETHNKDGSYELVSELVMD